MCRACRLEPDPERKPVAVAHLGLHAHTCSECGKLRTCYANPCVARGRGDDKGWVCFVCVDDAKAKSEVKLATQRREVATLGGKAHARKAKREAAA
jgi:hypothetical protein